MDLTAAERNVENTSVRNQDLGTITSIALRRIHHDSTKLPPFRLWQIIHKRGPHQIHPSLIDTDQQAGIRRADDNAVTSHRETCCFVSFRIGKFRSLNRTEGLGPDHFARLRIQGCQMNFNVMLCNTQKFADAGEWYAKE